MKNILFKSNLNEKFIGGILMKETYVEYTMNEKKYRLETEGSIFRIIRDEKVIHVQLNFISSHKPCLAIGLKNLNEVVGNLKEYILFCENNSVFNGISFSEDEWARHTKIYAKFSYKTKDGEILAFKQDIDSVRGEMRGFQADGIIDEKYITFTKNITVEELKEQRKRPVTPISDEEFRKILEGKNEGFDVYQKLNK